MYTWGSSPDLPHCRWVVYQLSHKGSPIHGKWNNGTAYNLWCFREDHGICPITSWAIDRETVETVSDFILGSSKITADGDCSHEIKRCLLLGRKVMTNLDSIFKSRDIHLPTKVHLVKAMVYPIVTYGCESWMVKKAERRRIDALNCGVGEDSWESLGLQGDPRSPS